jgi:ABC-type Fe3+-siderophore transport system permease subunit
MSAVQRSRHPARMAVPQTPSYPSARVIAELAREAQRQQLHSIEALDSKAATLIGFGGVLLGLVFSASIATDHWNRVLTVGVALLAAGIAGLLLLLFARRYRYNPNVLTLGANYLDQPEDQTLKATIESIEAALVWNAELLKWKVRLLNAFAAIAVIAILLIAGSLLYAVN